MLFEEITIKNRYVLRRQVYPLYSTIDCMRNPIQIGYCLARAMRMESLAAKGGEEKEEKKDRIGREGPTFVNLEIKKIGIRVGPCASCNLTIR